MRLVFCQVSMSNRPHVSQRCPLPAVLYCYGSDRSVAVPRNRAAASPLFISTNPTGPCCLCIVSVSLLLPQHSKHWISLAEKYSITWKQRCRIWGWCRYRRRSSAKPSNETPGTSRGTETRMRWMGSPSGAKRNKVKGQLHFPWSSIHYSLKSYAIHREERLIV